MDNVDRKHTGEYGCTCERVAVAREFSCGTATDTTAAAAAAAARLDGCSNGREEKNSIDYNQHVIDDPSTGAGEFILWKRLQWCYH